VTICANCLRENRADARFCDSCGASLDIDAVQPETRKTVSILFCDVVGSTARAEANDPEVVRSTMNRYFEAASPVIERHGGTVEKFIGDAVMAVFGVPVVHEDDALRAVRTAAQLRDMLAELGVTVRFGVATGEAVTGAGQTLGSGDVFNLAARLQGAAEPGQVLISDATLELVRDAVTVDAMPPLVLKGKRDAVTAWRLGRVLADAPGIRRAAYAQLVGRDRELQLLIGAFERCQAERRCHLVTVLGAAGIGKSRLTGELVRTVDARWTQGRCLPYGDGITYLPVAEGLAGLAGAAPAADWLRSRLGEGDGARAVDVAAAALGFGGASSTPEGEIPWALGRCLEAAAGSAPLIVVFDDVQWAEPALLDVIDYLVDWCRSASILVVCLARTELLEIRPGWGGGKVNSAMMLLEPLSEAQSLAQIDALSDSRTLPPELRRKVAETSGGNPLFAEQMVAMMDSGAQEVVVPASVQALLAARIDALAASERSVLEAAAVEGQEFHGDAITTLVGDGIEVTDQLRALVRQELVEPRIDGGGSQYAFRHLLIRDAAYESISLSRRARLHASFADWWDQAMPTDAPQHQAILGYHLDTAYRCHEQLGDEISSYAELAARAGVALGSAAESAWKGWDGTCGPLFDRAIELLPAGHPARAELLMSNIWVQFHVQAKNDRIDELIGLGLDEAAASGDEVIQVRFELARTIWQISRGEDLAIDDRRRQADEAIGYFETVGETSGAILALNLLALTEQDAMQGERTRAIAERMLAIGDRTGERVAVEDGGQILALAVLDGPVPTDEAIAICERLAATTPGPARGIPLQYLSELLAARCEFDLARQTLAAAEAAVAPLGNAMAASYFRWTDGAIEMLAGRWAVAEAALRQVQQALIDSEEGWALGGIGALLGEALLEQDRVREARDEVEAARAHLAPRSTYYQAWWRRAMARVEARDGNAELAVSLAVEALALIEQSDWLYFRAETELALADVLRRAGREEEARAAASRALAQCESKRHLAGIRRVERFLDEPATGSAASMTTQSR
jgi:class 3 adenylate cyclase/tetratricopeptide (TPR) repeat protein